MSYHISNDVAAYGPILLYSLLSVTSFATGYLAWKAGHKAFAAPYCMFGLLEGALALCHWV